MKPTRTMFGSTIAALAIATLAITTGSKAAPGPLVQPEKSRKRLIIDCAQGWRGGAGGSYGGVSFDINCSNGRAQQMIEGTIGTAYTIRMGVENESIGADCFYSGDSETVNEQCVAVKISIR